MSSGADNMTAEERLAMGEALSAMAYAEPPITPHGLALALIIVSLIIMGLATAVIGLRIYARTLMTKGGRVFGWEDTFAVLSYAAFLTSGIFAIKAAYYGLGTHDTDLNQYLMIRCAEYLLYSSVMYGFSMPLVKASVVFTLLRFTTESKYRWTLYAMQFVATAMAIIGILASLLYCSPVPAYWNPLLGKCGNFMTVVYIGYAWTAVGIVTDWTCAILPWFVIRKLQMSRKTKMTVMSILGLGAVASTATIVRAPYLQYFLVQVDRLYWNGHITLWCLLESGLGIIAASLPALRSLFVRYLENTRYGSGSKGSKLSSSGYVLRSGNRKPGESGTQLDTLKSGAIGHNSTVSGGPWKRLDDDSSSKGIIVHERVMVESESWSDVEAHSNSKYGRGNDP